MRYEVRRNRCDCHPETCCHGRYNVFDTLNQVIYISFDDRDNADRLANDMNELWKYKCDKINLDRLKE